MAKGKANSKSKAPTPRKTTKKTETTPSTPKAPKGLRFDETPGQALEHTRQKLTAKTKAKKTNPPDVFVLTAELMDNNERALAGYLGLPNTRTLRELVEPPENNRLLRAHIQAREIGFDVKGKNAATSYPTADIFECLRITDDDWLSFPSVPLAPQHTEYRAERSFLISIRLFLQHNPNLVLDPKWPGTDKIHGFHAED